MTELEKEYVDETRALLGKLDAQIDKIHSFDMPEEYASQFMTLVRTRADIARDLFFSVRALENTNQNGCSASSNE